MNLSRAALITLPLVVFAVIGASRSGPRAAPPPAPLPAPAALEVEWGADAFGRSGALRVRVTLPGERFLLPLEWRSVRPKVVNYRWVPVLGTPTEPTAARALGGRGEAFAPTDPGVYELVLESDGLERRIGNLQLVVRVPFDAKQGGMLNGYRIGSYPTEGQRRKDRYATPEGFIEVTRDNADLQLSDHFKVREFLTHDQQNVWPKYAIVEPRLLEKLELVMAELNAMGVPAKHMVIMSGYRTPQYNNRGLNRGRAKLSRHQYGDAADVWVDNDGDWYIDDLNGDGRRDTRDARVILQAVERVEARHRELVGGAGIYGDNGAHGPFIHIDTRGYRARW